MLFRKIWQPVLIIAALILIISCNKQTKKETHCRESISLNEGWKFFRYNNPEKTDNLHYDVRPDIEVESEYLVADARPTEAVETGSSSSILKPWILPTANPFIAVPTNRHARPEGEAPGKNFPFVQSDFDDSDWERVNLPHDWAIEGPFYEGDDPVVGGGMGRLPVQPHAPLPSR